MIIQNFKNYIFTQAKEVTSTVDVIAELQNVGS